jgi:hypothetical protein
MGSLRSHARRRSSSRDICPAGFGEIRTRAAASAAPYPAAGGSARIRSCFVSPAALAGPRVLSPGRPRQESVPVIVVLQEIVGFNRPLFYHLAYDREYMKNARAAIDTALGEQANLVLCTYPDRNPAFALATIITSPRPPWSMAAPTHY